MRLFLGMITVALLLDGAMCLEHKKAQRAGSPQETVSLVADAGQEPPVALLR